jgi:hypothetical protein
MANVYHIDSFQNTKIEPVSSNNDKMLSILNAIDEISLCDVKIRENSQYHIFDIFKLPEI